MVQRPGLDHYIGRAFDELLTHEEDDSNWGIKLEGGVIIWNKDGRRTNASYDLAATSLLTVIYAETDTTLVFGTSNNEGVFVTNEITLTPTQYTIAEPSYNGGDEIYPQSLEPEDAGVPTDPSADRVADGPDAEWLAAQEASLEAQEATDDE